MSKPPQSGAGRDGDVAALRRETWELQAANQKLARRVQELENAADTARDTRRATLNVLEDAMASQLLADELNGKLANENADRRRAEATLRISEQRIRALVANLPGGAVFVVNRDLIFEVAEGEALREAGLKGADLVGRPLQDSLPPAHVAEIVALFHEALAGKPFLREYDSDGRGFLSRGVPLRDANGEIEGVLAVSFDITARRRAEEALRENQRELQAALQTAQDAHQAKDQFIAALSHELRTPLTPILITAGLNADDARLSKHVRAQFETIRANVRLEARLIDDLLDQTEIQRGKTRLDKLPVDAHAILRDALLTVAPDFAKKGIAPVLTLKARDSRLSGDPVRLQQIFWNVLRNAAKFTEDGGRVEVRTSNPAKDRFAVTVTDNGIGLTREEIGRMFQPFAQGDHAEIGAPKHFGGLGLGLAISRELVELHGGTIGATSAGRGRGASVVITLPLTTRPVRASKTNGQDAGRASPGAHPRRSTPGRHALLVEDHAPTRAALKMLLARRGYTVIEAATVQEAMKRAVGQDFDVVVSDLGLPDGSGHEVIKQVHARQPGVPAISLSGFGMENDVRRAKAAGFTAHLTKPIGIEQLDATLDEMEHEAAARK